MHTKTSNTSERNEHSHHAGGSETRGQIWMGRAFGKGGDYEVRLSNSNNNVKKTGKGKERDQRGELTGMIAVAGRVL